MAAYELVSRLADPVEDVESWESGVQVIGSRIGESLLRCTIMTSERKAHRLAEWEPMSKLCGF